MGNGLCRRTGRNYHRTTRVDGFYRKFVFNYAKQWNRYSDKHEHSNCGEKNAKHNKSKKNKPVISGPFPADPDRLEGDKWRYVILTRLDTEPPPERPPRTKRKRQDTTASGRSWGSLRRRSFGRKRPSRPGRRTATVAPVAVKPSDRDDCDSAVELMRLALMVYLRRPNGRSLAARTVSPVVTMEHKTNASYLPSEKPPAARRGRSKKSFPWVLCSSGRTRGRSWFRRGHPNSSRNGLFRSVDRVTSMTNNLLL